MARRRQPKIEDRIMLNPSHVSKVFAQIRVREREGVPGRGLTLVPGTAYDLSVEVAPGETLADVTRPEWFEGFEETPEAPAAEATPAEVPAQE